MIHKVGIAENKNGILPQNLQRNVQDKQSTKLVQKEYSENASLQDSLLSWSTRIYDLNSIQSTMDPFFAKVDNWLPFNTC